MKKLINIFLAVVLIVSCSEDSDILTSEQLIINRTVAYENLSGNEKQSLTKDWRDATVVLGKYDKNGDTHILVINSETKYSFFLSQQNIVLTVNQSLAAVTFNTKDDLLLGPITTIVDPSSKTIVGFVGRL